jgi:predicted type IV restriction endonuclease
MDRKLALEQVSALVNKYQEKVRNGRIAKYNEEMTKKDFILPLFEALGWKTSDSIEVSAEEKISKMRVDYGFRVNGIPKFFLEAKSFREDLDNRKFIEQAINYSWHKGCTWAVLTNFESLKIFNAEVKTDHPWLSQLKPTLHCSEFVAKFDELLLLSKESFENKLLDSEAEKWGKKSKKTPIDKQLLTDFTRFRSIISKNITKLNSSKKITEQELDESVQRILDRLMFIRNAEDRELEPKTLIANYREWESKGKGNLIKSLRATFLHFDKEYNSKIFAKHLCDDLELDNEVLHEVIEGLYTTKDNETYDFSIIDADVLGTIYEQYLGHILRKTEKTAKVTENHAHRKEQGIYYTPTYIVNFIVVNTLGELLKDKKVDIEKVKVLDPACGSGSFLIKAFDFLNNYYLNRMKADYHQTRFNLETVETGTPFKTKSRILQNNVFGVDLDKQAVEITQLNLLLKIAEKGELLPLLEENIKMGNSLIDSEELAGNKAFKWNEEYNEIMANGGFDVIIGNPPYYNIKSDSELRKLEDYKFLSNGVVNVSALFMKHAIDLLKPHGYLGFIIPKSFTYVDSWKPLRDFLYSNTQLLKVVDVSEAFKEVLLEQVIVVVKKQQPKEKGIVSIISHLNSDKQTIHSVELRELLKKNTINFQTDGLEQDILKKMGEQSVLLGSISENFRGIGAQRDISKDKSNGERILSGKEIQRYSVTTYHEYYIKPELLQHYPKSHKVKQPKIMCQNIVAFIRNHIKITATYDESGVLDLDTVNNIIVKSNRFNPKYILALLNSKLISHYTYNFIYSKAVRTMHFDGSYSGKIPIRNISLQEQECYVNQVDKLLKINRRLEELGPIRTDEYMKLCNNRDKIDRELDFKIYKLYGLDDEEIDLVEKLYE